MKITVEQVIEAIRDAGLEPREYSGRGMYGKHCLGVDTDRAMVPDAIAVAVNLMENGATAKDVKEWGDNTHYDTMGRGMILYWPALELSEEQVGAFIGEDEG